MESAGQRRRAGGRDALQTEVASDPDPDPDPGFLSSNWNKTVKRGKIGHLLYSKNSKQ